MIMQQPGPPSGQNGHLPAIRTLILDDSNFDRKRILRLGDRIDLPLVFEEASSVEGLKHCLDRQVFDLFLIDYSMPEGDGLDALQVIRAHENHKDAASIMISGAADSRVAVSAMKQGCRDFLTKDEISSDSLQRAMIEALNGNRQFARHFDRARPVMDIENLRHIMQLALDDKTIREILRAPLEAEFKSVARMADIGWGLQATPDLHRFLIDFDQADEFEFR